MARRVRNVDLETRESRRKLKVRGKPYWAAIGLGLHLGYRKGRRNGMWVARKYLGDRTYKLTTIALADDIEDADGVHVHSFWQAQEIARNLRTARSGPYTVKQAVDDYLNGKLSERASYRDVVSRMRVHVLPTFGSTPVDELTADAIREWHRKLARTPRRIRAPKDKVVFDQIRSEEDKRKREHTANRTLGWFKAVLNYAITNGKAKCSPIWSQAKGFRGADVARSRYLTHDECRRLIASAHPKFKLLVQAALHTGCRYSELCRLAADDFNAAAGTLHIRRSKSGGDRHVILTDEGTEFFRSLRNTSGPMLGEWREGMQGRYMREACERAGIDYANFHALRHSWASLSVMAGMPLMVVAKNLGHVDTRMVEKHYGHLAPSFIVDAIRATAPRFGMAGPSNVRSL
jgi:integrase